jgi:hypothetical protein
MQTENQSSTPLTCPSVILWQRSYQDSILDSWDWGQVSSAWQQNEHQELSPGSRHYEMIKLLLSEAITSRAKLQSTTLRHSCLQ